MKKTNICRPIIFCNHFVPAVENRGLWMYGSFGSFDGVEVHEKIVNDNAGGILSGIWNHQNRSSKEMEGKYTSQTVYAFCYAEESREENFWQDDENLPFTFFCRMQFKDNISYLRDNKEKLENFLQNREDIQFFIYTSYDNSDLIIVLKTDLYSKGAELVNEFHQGFNFSFEQDRPCRLKNSFTVFAVKQDIINKTEDNSFREKLNQKETIDLVSVRIIEGTSKRILKLKDVIEKEIKYSGASLDMLQPILGIDDELLFLRNIKWGDFLYLYHNDKNIFYSDFIAGTTTTICMKVDMKYTTDDENGDKEKKIDNDPVHTEIIYKEYLKILSEKAKQIADSTGKYKELNMILNILPKFSEAIFSDYLFFSVLKPLGILTELIQGGSDDSYYEFIKRFNVYVQNSTKSDRHAMQSMDFNAKIYDIPAKLNAFIRL